jgi:hypothetical protein
MKTYSIPVENLDQFERKMQRLTSKAKKLGTETVAYRKLHERKEEYKPGQFIQVIDVQVVGVAPVINGWQFVAKLEPAGSENLVYHFHEDGYLPAQFRTNEMFCQHCNQNRQRKSVYVVEHVKEGTFRQVGSTCLADFTGHPSPQQVASAAECILELDDLQKEFEFDPDFEREPEYLKIEQYLAWVVKSINQDGWHSRSNGYRPTADSAMVAWTTAHLSGEKLTQEEKEEARKALNWIRSTWAESTNLNDYQWNMVQATEHNAIPVKHIGLVASLIPAYRREMDNQATNGHSKWQGQIKKRQDWTNLTVTAIHTFEGHYGMSYMHKFVDNDGNVLVWTTSKRLEKGQTYSGKATVKKHDEYRGIKQTVLTRAKFS